MNRTLLMGAVAAAVLALSSLAQAAEWADMGHVHDIHVDRDGTVYMAAHDGLYRMVEGEPQFLAKGHYTSLAMEGRRLTLAGFDARGQPAALSFLAGEGRVEPAPKGEIQHVLAVAADGGSGLYAVVGHTLFHRAEPGDDWDERGALPEEVIDMAALAPEGRVYAATAAGLMRSKDGGRTWGTVSRLRTPATAVSEFGDELYVFQYKLGLMRSPVADIRWDVLSNDFGQQVPVRMGADGDGRLYASTNRGWVFMSTNAGESWRRVDRIFPDDEPSAAARRGEAIYKQSCASCHGTDGVGEAPRLGEREEGLAPALDETMHAWHHTDANLRQVIREGTGGRMPGWGGALSEAQIKDVVAYMKSLWDERALRCQGPAHMNPDCRGN